MMILYVPWHQRRVWWRHDHNAADARDWRPEKVSVVGKLIRIGAGMFQAKCPCGTLFVAEANHHLVYPPVAAMGII